MENSGVTIVLHWYDYIIIGAAVLTALGVVWRYVAAPLWRTGRLVEEAVPVLLSIAKEFERDGGNTLKDDINALGDRIRTMEDEQTAFQTYVHRRFHDLLNLMQVLRHSMDLAEELGDEVHRMQSLRNDMQHGSLEEKAE